MTTQTHAFEEAVAAIPSCALDEEGIEAQKARHARLAPSVTELTHTGEAIEIVFASDYDRQTLVEMVAVEQQCCPFFSFAFDEETRRLEVTVKDPAMVAALDVMADTLGKAHASRD